MQTQLGPFCLVLSFSCIGIIYEFQLKEMLVSLYDILLYGKSNTMLVTISKYFS